GNPYPSYLNWESAIKNNLLSSIWYRSKKQIVYIFDTFNSVGGLGTNNSGKGSVTKYIPPMQAFWIRVMANQTSGKLTVNNTMRSHTLTSNMLKSKAETNSDQQVLRLQISNGTNSDEAIVYFNANASDGFDTYDSPKMFNGNSLIPEIYTLAGTEQVAINGLNKIKYNEKLPLGLNTINSNTLSLQATEISNFDEDTKIFLRDNLLETDQELAVGTVYDFSSEVVNSTNRFSLILKTKDFTTEQNKNIENPAISVFRIQNGQIRVNFSGDFSGQSDICVYNSLGQMVENRLSHKSNTYLTGVYIPGVYLIRINYNGFKYFHKIQL
ncbi:MAG TPA: T9SS type A sorting domain-containing protein, partial [Paludibacter sp.]|nr:T9SS type A sorting domain-containing protein [Paludibacter sp.]